MQRKKGYMPPRKYSYNQIKDLFRKNKIVTPKEMIEAFNAENNVNLTNNINNILAALEQEGFLIAQLDYGKLMYFKEVKYD